MKLAPLIILYIYLLTAPARADPVPPGKSYYLWDFLIMFLTRCIFVWEGSQASNWITLFGLLSAIFWIISAIIFPSVEWNLFNSSNLFAGVCNLLQYIAMLWGFFHRGVVNPEESQNVPPEYEPLINNQNDGEEEEAVNVVNKVSLSFYPFGIVLVCMFK